MTKSLEQRINDIDAILPQTQCGLCEHGACRPYAESLAKGEDSINRCPPGGVVVLQKLADYLGQDATPYLEELQQKAKPVLKAVVREAECIGCTKCITACPVDAIIGAAKQMHVVLTDACTGCELCVPPCPMDCIDMIEQVDQDPEAYYQQHKNTWREQYQQRQFRLQRLKQQAKNKHDQARQVHPSDSKEQTVAARKQAIADVLARVKARKKYD